MTVMLPPQLEIAFQALGVPWPTQDEDGLRAGAAAYRECAAALAVQVTPLVRESLGRAAGGNAGLHMEAVAAFWDELDREDDRSGHLSRLATTLHVLADGHEAAARLVEALKAVLVALAAGVVAVLIWAVAAAAVSGGAAALQARSALLSLRAAATRFCRTFVRELERFFARDLATGVRTLLHPVLHARKARTVTRERAAGRPVGAAERDLLARLSRVREKDVVPYPHAGDDGVYLITFDDGGHVIYKLAPARSPRETVPRSGMPRREAESYRFSERLGWDLVPPTTTWDGPYGHGSVQLWVENARGGRMRGVPEIQRERAAVFDYVIGSLDRHSENYLTDEAGGLRLIDNALSHPRSHTRAMRSPFLVAYRDEPLSPGVVADLRALDLEEETRLLRESGFGHREIRGRLRRLQELREHGMITSSAWRGHIQSGDSW
ncbi:hypothetical protein [Nonomuraea sp. NPDC005692]|uniref:hypothetical protein n=1 Tax=Nonomuraea sp. NPDC005692 TaxID=3157168 RepID=UPI0033D40165